MDEVSFSSGSSPIIFLSSIHEHSNKSEWKKYFDKLAGKNNEPINKIVKHKKIFSTTTTTTIFNSIPFHPSFTLKTILKPLLCRRRATKKESTMRQKITIHFDQFTAAIIHNTIKSHWIIIVVAIENVVYLLFLRGSILFFAFCCDWESKTAVSCCRRWRGMRKQICKWFSIYSEFNGKMRFFLFLREKLFHA